MPSRTLATRRVAVLCTTLPLAGGLAGLRVRLHRRHRRHAERVLLGVSLA